MVAIRQVKRLQDLDDVDPNGLPDQGVPIYSQGVSSFVVQTIAAGGGGSFSLGASNLGNTLGDTGITGSRVVLAGIGNLTLSQATDGNGGTISISGGTAGAGFSAGISGGNTAGDTGATGTRLALAGGNGITLSGATDANGGTVSIVGPTTQPSFSAGVSGGNTVGDTGATGTRLVFAGGNSITLSQATDANGGTITISGATTSQSLQPETQTFVGGIIASNTTYTSGSIRFTGVGGGVTVSSNTGQRVDISVASQSVQTQNLVDVTAAGNTAGVLALVSSGTLTLAGGNSITLSQNGNAITISGATTSQSVQTQNVVDVTAAGNTAGVLALVSSGTLTLAGGNNITVSQNGNAITISGANVGGAQTGISGLANTETTYTSGTVKLLELGAITIRSTTGQQFQLSVNAQTVESQSIGMSNVGNTSGTTGMASGGQVRFVLAGGNNITLSQSLNGASGTLTISAFNQSAESNTLGMSNLGNTSGTTGVVSAAQVRLLFAGGNNITLSQSLNGASGTITISGPSTAAQSVQTLGMYAVQNTTGQSSSTTMDARTLSVAGDGIVSVGYSAGSLRISASQSVQAETQTFIGGIANSETTYTSGTVKISELGAVTFRSTTGNQFQVSVNAQTVESQSIGMSNLGNTAGTTGMASGGQVRFVIVGTNNITVSQSLNGASGTISISGGAGGAFSAGISGGNTSGDTGATGTRVVLAGGNNITLSGATDANGGTITVSAFTQSVESQSIGMSNIGNTSGTTGVASGGQVRFLIAGGNNITLSQSLNGASGTLTISAFNQSAQTLGMYAVQNTTGQSSSTTMDARTLSVAGDGAVSVGYSNGSLRISAPSQTGTQFSGGISGGNTSGDTGTVGGRLVFAGGNNITLSGSTNGASETISISAFTQSVESQSIGMSNLGNTAGTTGVASGGQVRFVIVGTNNITMSQSLNGASGTISVSGQPSFSAGVSTGGNTQGNTGVSGTRLVLVGSDNITLSQATDASGATVSLKGVSPGAAAYSVGVSNLGNTAGSTGVTGTRIVLAGTGSVTLSQSTDATGATISISAGGGFSAGASNLGNTAGNTGVSGSQLVLVGTNPISLSQTTGANGATVSIDGPVTSSIVGASGISISTSGSTISVIPIQNTSFSPYSPAQAGTGQQGNATLHIAPYQVPHVAYDRILLGFQGSNATNSSNSWTMSVWVGIYTRNNSTLSLVSSISTSTNFSAGGTTGSYSLWAGPRWLSVPWTMTLSSGDYYFGIVSRTTTGGGAGQTLNQLVRTDIASAWSGLIGVGSNVSAQQRLGLGVYSVSTAGIPSSFAFADIVGSGSIMHMEPLWHLRSGTV